jgi:thioredoxin 1
MSRIQYIQTSNDFYNIISSAPASQLIVINFTASWCGPCKRIAPIIDKFADKYPSVAIFKLDVDEVADVASQMNVQGMPTFVFIRNSVEIHRFTGADQAKLEQTIAKFA